MTRSIFDPTGGETERSGSRNLGPAADNISHMPPDVVDGEVSEEEAADIEALAADTDEAGEEGTVAAEGAVEEPGAVKRDAASEAAPEIDPNARATPDA